MCVMEKKFEIKRVVGFVWIDEVCFYMILCALESIRLSTNITIPRRGKWSALSNSEDR